MSKPTHKLFQVIKNPGTFTLRLNAVPLSGELVIRPANSDDTDQE